ncbi:MAG: NADH-quinone oxidoreductase subunit L [Saprospiraceae bacterium]|nr:NADH-quinone oxidoreductase subunit L [Saprospiraceae bacterium]
MIQLIPLLPLFGFAFNGLFGKQLPKSVVGIIGSGTVLVSFILSILLFFQTTENVSLSATLFNWMDVGGWQINFSFLVDRLSNWMMLIITGIGFLIHIYSIGYMHNDDGFYKFFAYLNLFIFSMLILVMADNYLIMFFGWEGVGLCSYLLIGFWYNNLEYGYASRKAFIMNRIGDLGLLLGIFLIFTYYGSVNYADVFPQASKVAVEVNTLITFLLFVGAMGKSAQIPLYTWLPDAMAGPTPVSALIHAATMVTAGVYLIVRSNIIYSLTPLTGNIIVIIGLTTAMLSALVALKQTDIKKVLAYSTVSQLGYMFVAAGLGAYTSAMFHLTTHAFFKALLFLAAGSVIHAMGGEQNMLKMGGLRKATPITFITCLLATLAITGCPPLAGFFSKDEILAAAISHNKLIFTLLSLTSVLTAIYMFRMLFLTFYGKFRGTHEQEHHLHESPSVMTLPLIILAILSVFGGFLGIPEIFAEGKHYLNDYFSPIYQGNSLYHPTHASHTAELIIMGFSVIVLGLVVFMTYNRYAKSTITETDNISEMSFFQKLSYNKFYVDELYDSLFVKPIEQLSRFFYSIIDKYLIDGGVVGVISQSIGRFSNGLRLLQNGNIEYYLFGMVAGLMAILLSYFYYH